MVESAREREKKMVIKNNINNNRINNKKPMIMTNERFLFLSKRYNTYILYSFIRKCTKKNKND